MALQLSPLGKVPLQRVDDDGIFESQAINAFLDETHTPSMLAEDPLERARQRAYTALAENLLGGLWSWVSAKDEATAEEARTGMTHNLKVLDAHLSTDGPFFSGEAFSLTDCAFAPFFMRLDRLEAAGAQPLPLEGLERVARYRQALAELEAVRDSVVAEFDQLYLGFVKGQGGVLAGQLA